MEEGTMKDKALAVSSQTSCARPSHATPQEHLDAMLVVQVSFISGTVRASDCWWRDLMHDRPCQMWSSSGWIFDSALS